MNDTLLFSDPYAKQYVVNPLRTLNSTRLNNLNFKYEGFTPSGCKDVGIKKFEFVGKN